MEILFQVTKKILDDNDVAISESFYQPMAEYTENKHTLRSLFDSSGFQNMFSIDTIPDIGIESVTACSLTSTVPVYVKTEESDVNGILTSYMAFTGHIDNLWVKNDSGQDAIVSLYIWGN